MLWLQFTAVTGVIVFAGWNLSKHGDVIAEKTGLGRTWVGVIYGYTQGICRQGRE